MSPRPLSHITGEARGGEVSPTDLCAACGHERAGHSTGGMCAGRISIGGSECYCVRFPDAPDFTQPAPEQIAEPLSDEPQTEAGRKLLAREDYNSRSFALITAEAIVAIEQESRLAAFPATPDDGLDVERLRVALEIVGTTAIDDTGTAWRLYAEDVAFEYERAEVPLVEQTRLSETEVRSAGQRRRWAEYRAVLATRLAKEPTRSDLNLA